MTVDTPVLESLDFDFDHPLAGIEEIRQVNPHRHEFEMLTGIVYLDPARHAIVEFKDLRADDFWARGHMPGFPLLPGVLMCEAAAQLFSYYYGSQRVGEPGVLVGLAGIDEARFMRPVRPGDRLVMRGLGVKVHRRLTRFRVTGQVGGEKAFEAVITGVPLGKMEELRGA